VKITPKYQNFIKTLLNNTKNIRMKNRNRFIKNIEKLRFKPKKNNFLERGRRINIKI